MARRKRVSESVSRAVTRAASLESIDTALDLGNNATLVAYKARIKVTADKLDAYNTRLSELDGLLNELEATESALDDMSTNMLAGVGIKYGKNSDEYEKAGGTRRSDRKTSARRAVAVAAK